MLARARPRNLRFGDGQQARIRAASTVVYTRIDDAIAHDLGQHWRVEFLAVELAEHHREIGALRIPRGLERGPELNLRRAVRTADCQLPTPVGWLCLLAFDEFL